jgi:hypothetical protein
MPSPAILSKVAPRPPELVGETAAVKSSNYLPPGSLIGLEHLILNTIYQLDSVMVLS